MRATPAGRSPAPAAFLRRYAAWSIDMALLLGAALLACAARVRAGAAEIATASDALAQTMARGLVDALLHDTTPLALARRWLADPGQRDAIAALSGTVATTVLPPLLLTAALALAWFAPFESSPWRATPGKRLLGLHVAGATGAHVGLPRAMVRHLAGALSWLTLNLGHLLALVPPRRQALHDRISGVRVLQEDGDGAGLPAWATAWLCLQGVLAVGATAWMFVAADVAMQRAFDALLP